MQQQLQYLVYHLYDAACGVYAALRIETQLKQLSKILANQSDGVVSSRKTSIDLTAGKVYCGLLGSGGSGCEYGILGDLVNLTARLMQHAGKSKDQGGLGEDEGGKLVSGDIRLQCEDCRNLIFQNLLPIQVKGTSRNIEVFRPRPPAVGSETIIYKSRYSIGFNQEYSEILDVIKDIIANNNNIYEQLWQKYITTRTSYICRRKSLAWIGTFCKRSNGQIQKICLYCCTNWY